MLTITFNLSSRYCGEMSNCVEIDLLLFGKICSQERSLCSWGNEGCIKCQCCTISPRTRQGAEQQSGTHVQMQGSKDTHSWCTAALLFSPNLLCCNSSKKAMLPLTAIKFKDTNKSINLDDLLPTVKIIQSYLIQRVEKGRKLFCKRNLITAAVITHLLTRLGQGGPANYKWFNPICPPLAASHTPTRSPFYHSRSAETTNVGLGRCRCPSVKKCNKNMIGTKAQENLTLQSLICLTCQYL